MSLSETIYNDPSTMERLCKIVEAIWNGTISFGNEGEGDIVCHIGGNWFYFYTGKLYADKITPENIKEQIDIFSLAQMILEAMTEIGDNEYEYYCCLLGL